MRAPKTNRGRAGAIRPPPEIRDGDFQPSHCFSTANVSRGFAGCTDASHSGCAARPASGRPVTGRSALPGRPDAPSRQLHTERVPMDLENPSGLGQVPADTLEDPQDDLLLELIRGLVERKGFGRPNLRDLLGQRHVQRQIVELDDGRLGQDHAALDDVLALTHVARPPVGVQGGQRLGRKPLDSLVEPSVVAPDEMIDEQRDVLDALAQRRHHDRHYVEPVVEIFAEGAAADGLLEVRVRRGDEAHVDLDRPGAADPLDLALLEYPQELGLELGPQGADLVEEERAALRELELAKLALVGAGERTLLVAEQVGLDESLGDRRWVDGDEGLLAPRALMVDGPRDELLAGTALAGDQHGRRRAGDLRDEAVELLDRGMPSDDLVEIVRTRQLGAKKRHFALERAALEGAS